MTGKPTILRDPLEAMVAAALARAGIHYTAGQRTAADLDFHLPGPDIHIEVKTYHSDRIARQMALAPNIIALQGRAAVEWFCAQLAKPGK